MDSTSINPVHSAVNAAAVDLPPILMQPSAWAYRGEGNANLVVAASVPADTDVAAMDPVLKRLGTHHVILRVAKSAHAAAADAPNAHSALDMAAFITHVVNPLFPPAHLPTLIPVRLPPTFLTSLRGHIDAAGARPAKRANHAHIDPLQPIALLSPDYARLGDHTLCIEIKPKWLFVKDAAECARPNSPPRTPSPIHTPSPVRTPSPTTGSQACRFCMHQQLKAAKDPHYAPSQLCPLDFLDEATVPDAVRALLATPHNNLRVWVDGMPVPVTAPKWSSVAVDTLCDMSTGTTDARAALTTLLTSVLSDLVPVLRTLGAHQRALDQFDPAHVHAEYLALAAQSVDPPHILLDEWRDVIDRYLARRAAVEAGTSPPAVDRFQLLAEYVLSMTLKDCSMLITVSKGDEVPEGDMCKQLPGGEGLVYRAVLLDLDPKALAKVPQWFELDGEIRAHFVNGAAAGGDVAGVKL
ncbi:Inositol-pentakisphosphate 2-kinase [Allomyces arbusculus]|nr:Inositol-pentakisphosphate 2-kinase [Allomyces arbusculus]